jgi:uncharacterized protein (DUF433 family)
MMIHAREEPPMPEIIDRGRGPEIAGTRITVYDILDYSTQNWHHAAIAAHFRISSAEVLAALDYIESHKAEVMKDYQAILDRCARGNPPELQAKLDALYADFEKKHADRIAQTEEWLRERYNGRH